MGDGHHGARKKKPSGQNKSYYYSLTYDEEDAGSVDYDGDDIQKRVASILAETEIDVHQNTNSATGSIDRRLDLNDNLFSGGGDDGSLRNSRSLDFELSDDDEFQSAESKSDTCRPDLETASIEDDFVHISRPHSDLRTREVDGGFTDESGLAFGTVTSEQSPKTSGSTKRTGSSPLSVVYVKQKPLTELYDGNFIDDDILQPQDERTLGDNISQDFLPMPVEEMTLEIEEDEDDGIPDTSSGVDGDPIIFRKSSQRCFARHRKLIIGLAIGAAILAAGGIAAIIYFAVTYKS